ncbi:hypothetical protein ETB97_006543 [Aspergillus alliaceus]|uniref:Uncharacterized protein n=1 Tax=Petromyces alliaceus TaxID=209559 RepID=A0A8H6E295_PETAA|nr:hypothetical protein ETB97_006543 [Aspergillus burnettii]
MAFDPTQPWDDPTVFFPNGMYIDNRPSNKRGKLDDDDDEKTFFLNASSLTALSRYIGSAKKLLTNRGEYLNDLSLKDDPELIGEGLRREIDDLMVTHTKIKGDCGKFKEETWMEILESAKRIREYADTQGGTTETSYYATIIEFVGLYWEEMQKEEPDPRELQELKDSIIYAVNKCRAEIEVLQGKVTEVIVELDSFKGTIEGHDELLRGNQNRIGLQLQKAGYDVEDIQEKIDNVNDEIADVQDDIDRKNKQISDARKYSWIGGLTGALIGEAVVAKFKSQLKALKESLTKLKALLKEYEQEQKLAVNLQQSVTVMKCQITELKDQIGPAKDDLGKLQGAWQLIDSQLEGIYKLVKFDTDNIPPVRMTKRQLQSIVDAWIKLEGEASDYIKTFYLSEDPEVLTLDEYIERLDNRLREIEMEERMQERMHKKLTIMA